jgi:uncharacterized protein
LTLVNISAVKLRLLLVIIWCIIFLSQSQPLALFSEYAGFSFLGVTGALFANSTGAGGGVVFMPFFKQLGFTPMMAVATSFAIQCCGMTAGAITWWAFYRKLTQQVGHIAEQWQPLAQVLLLTVPWSILGIALVQYNAPIFNLISEPEQLHMSFGLFSIALAVAIFATLPLSSVVNPRTILQGFDRLALMAIALVGGAITAWLSVGVGELVAVYLIFRRFNITFAIACAVILSAFSVWGAVIYHVLISQAVQWPVVLFAGAGAIVGGILAKRLVLHFSPRNLKLFFAAWILILGLGTLPY